VAELVDDQIVCGLSGRLAQEDHEVGGESVELAKPGQFEEPGEDVDPDALHPHRARVQVETIKAVACALERRERLLVHWVVVPSCAGDSSGGGLVGSSNTSTAVPSWSCWNEKR
jgi:hypothetical protein